MFRRKADLVDASASGTPSRRLRRWPGPALLATAAIPAVVLIVVTASTGALGVGPQGGGGDITAVQDAPRDTSADLRCLTRRVEDCLAEAVPRDEPHEAVCATCHNLWERGGDLSLSARSCSGGECHTDPVSAVPFHATVDAALLAECVHCHDPHDARIPDGGADQCSACHQEAGEAPAWTEGAARSHVAAPDLFDHDRHPGVSCASCHGTGPDHGAVRVTAVSQCRSCHHQPATDRDCVGCHEIDEVRAVSRQVTRALDIRIGSLDRPRRTLTFTHESHWDEGCVTCHTRGTAIADADAADCSGCHYDHHEPTATCTTCHEPPADGAHDIQAHLGCGGAACHQDVPPGIDPMPRTRAVCLACHVDLADHEPEQSCADCHVLPEPKQAAPRTR